MKGMLIKDLRLLMNQGRTLFLMLIVVAMIMSLADLSSPSFIVSYITIIFSFFTATTVSYDEYDNCYLFLMTLPITRKGYVNEKYVFGFISTCTAWLIGVIIGTVLMAVRHRLSNPLEWFGECSVYIFISWIFVSVMLPIRLKFEAEKAKYVNMIMIIVCCILIFGGIQFAEYLPDFIVQSGIDFFNGLGNAGFIALIVLIAAVAVGISYTCSRHIIEHKEF